MSRNGLQQRTKILGSSDPLRVNLVGDEVGLQIRRKDGISKVDTLAIETGDQSAPRFLKSRRVFPGESVKTCFSLSLLYLHLYLQVWQVSCCLETIAPGFVQLSTLTVFSHIERLSYALQADPSAYFRSPEAVASWLAAETITTSSTGNLLLRKGEVRGKTS